MGAAKEVIKHSFMRTASVVCVLLVVGIIGWCIYAVIIKPQVSPLKNQEQIADTITNVTEAEKGSSASLFPPKIKINFDFKIFDFEK